MKEELNYKELASKLLEGACIIALELFALKVKHKEINYDDGGTGAPIEMFGNAWAAKYISDMSEIDEDTLTQLAEEEENGDAD